MVVLYGVRRKLAGVIDHKPSFARAARRPWLTASIGGCLWGKQGAVVCPGDLYSSYGETMEN